MSGDGNGRLAGKIALVTGAASGIGEAIARVFASHGAQVLVSDIREDAGRAVAAEIGAGARFAALDVRDPDAWTRIVAGVRESHGGIDILVNNAGAGIGGGIERETLEGHRGVLDLNVTGVWLGNRAAIPAREARAGGHTVTLLSIDG
ncbi:MAG: SDR family NAD(P)-dependent oxidoreductase, partial [Novosphingobium sp.]